MFHASTIGTRPSPSSKTIPGRNETGARDPFTPVTISRTAAWVIGPRNMQKALLRALLRPQARL